MASVRFAVARPEDEPQVASFNERMRQAGAGWRLSTARPFSEYVLAAGSPVILERYFLWVEDVLRGGVVIKRLPFVLGGSDSAEVAFYGYPVSEGVINPEFGFVGLLLQKFVRRQYPLAYGLGVGSLEAPVARLMRANGWQYQAVPFRFYIFHAAAFLREIRFLRSRHVGLRLFADFVAVTGLGTAGLAAWRVGQRLMGRGLRSVGPRREPVRAWSGWADAIWEGARAGYALIGDRSSASLSVLYPDGHPHLRRWSVLDQEGHPVGWAVTVVARRPASPHFGNLMLGTLVDCLALPGHETEVVAAALHSMKEAGAELAVVNHSGANFLRACDRLGLMPGPTNFFLFLSPNLSERMGAWGKEKPLHFTRGDGDGPIHLY